MVKLPVGIAVLIVLLLGVAVLSCAGVSSDADELFTASQSVTTEAEHNLAVPGYMAGMVPWEAEDDGVVPVATLPAAELTPGDGKMTMSLSRVPFIAPDTAQEGKAASALADGAGYYLAENVCISEVQGVTFDPSTGDAYACFELDLDGAAPYTVGLAWYSLPSEMDGYYIGIGDRTHSTWHWYLGPDDGVLTFDTADWAGGSGMGNSMLVCVLLEQGLPADFWQLKSGVSEIRGTGLEYEDPTQYIDTSRAASAAKSASTLPATADLRPFAPPINNQGSMGSCTAFGVADSAYNIMLSQIYSNHQWDVTDDDFRASPMWCYVKSGISPYGSWSPVCGSSVGRYMSQPFSLLQGTGSATETTVPYYATENCSTSFTQQAFDRGRGAADRQLGGTLQDRYRGFDQRTACHLQPAGSHRDVRPGEHVPVLQRRRVPLRRHGRHQRRARDVHRRLR